MLVWASLLLLFFCYWVFLYGCAFLFCMGLGLCFLFFGGALALVADALSTSLVLISLLMEVAIQNKNIITKLFVGPLLAVCIFGSSRPN